MKCGWSHVLLNAAYKARVSFKYMWNKYSSIFISTNLASLKETAVAHGSPGLSWRIQGWGSACCRGYDLTLWMALQPHSARICPQETEALPRPLEVAFIPHKSPVVQVCPSQKVIIVAGDRQPGKRILTSFPGPRRQSTEISQMLPEAASSGNHHCFLQNVLWLKPAVVSFHTAQTVNKYLLFKKLTNCWFPAVGRNTQLSRFPWKNCRSSISWKWFY